MTRPPRILLLTPNRYRALLLQKALSRPLPEAIVVRFDSAVSAIEELLSSVYQAVVLDLDALTLTETNQLRAALYGNRTSGIVLLRTPETPASKRRFFSQCPGTVCMDAAESADRIAATVMSTLKIPDFGASFGPKTNSLNLSRPARAKQ